MQPCVDEVCCAVCVLWREVPLPFSVLQIVSLLVGVFSFGESLSVGLHRRVFRAHRKAPITCGFGITASVWRTLEISVPLKKYRENIGRIGWPEPLSLYGVAVPVEMACPCACVCVCGGRAGGGVGGVTCKKATTLAEHFESLSPWLHSTRHVAPLESGVQIVCAFRRLVQPAENKCHSISGW